MKLIKSFKMALNMVLHSKLRSWLTIIGIVIGVASVIAIVSIGDGMEASISSQFDSIGGDILTITSGVSKARFGPGSHGATESGASAEDNEIGRLEYQVLRGLSDVDIINPKISGSAEVYYLGEKGSVSVTGVDQKVYSDIATTEILSGRNLDSADSNVVVIGGRLATEYFEKEIGINQLITIEERSFRVVGILDDSSTSVIMPIESAYQILEDKEREIYDVLEIKVRDEDNLDLAISNIEKKLMMVRHVDESSKDFTVNSNAAINEMRSEMLSTVTMFLTAIAGVSLLVGAVGVANTMFTSVLEKTKEIGIMKAIGARNGDVLAIFVFNSGLIGLVGGIIGVIIGYLISKLLSMVGLDTLVSFSTVFWILILSVGIGMVAGIIPAYNASKLKPVDALRSD